MEPSVSVIIPVYNSENYIKRCLESIINQTYNNLQIIVVDDGSNDSSRNICEDYAKLDDRITVINKENDGVSSARNTGINYSKGNYITFVDSDDYIEPDMIKRLVSLAIEYKADIVMCGYSKKRQKDSIANKEMNSYIKKYNNVEAINDILDKNKFHGYVCNKLFSTEIINKGNIIRFNEEIYVCEDMLFCIECFLKTNKIVYDNTKYYNYILHDNNTSSKFNKKKLTALNSYEKIINLIDGRKDININRFKACYMQIVISYMMQNMASNEDVEITKELMEKLSNIRVTEITDRKTIIAYYLLRVNPFILRIIWQIRRKLVEFQS